MSQDADKESKTEAATAKKIQDAIEKGNVPVSREVAMLGSLAGMLLAAWFLLPDSVKHLRGTLERLIDNPGDFRIEAGTDAISIFHAVLSEAAGAFLPVVLTFGIIGVMSTAAQNTPRMTLNRIQPKASNISLKKGWERVFGIRGFVEFSKSLFKLIVVGGLAAFLIYSSQGDVINALYTEPTMLPGIVLSTILYMIAGLTVPLIALVVADLAWTRHKWHRDLRMTKQEVKDEHKQMDGDPIIKSRLKSLQRDRARRRMIDDVPKATLVIANPTHYAVALRYVKSESKAPMVVAKGRDLIALKIREVAEKNEIPVIEDKALARSLYKAVEVDRMIPPEFYKAVAELIIYLTKRGRVVEQGLQEA